MKLKFQKTLRDHEIEIGGTGWSTYDYGVG